MRHLNVAAKGDMLFAASVIPHGKQRYPTTGDWFFADPSGIDSPLVLLVSDMQNRDYEFLIAVHEQIEAWLCRAAGVSEESVSRFDVLYEQRREHIERGEVFNPLRHTDDLTREFNCSCVPSAESEPGDDPHAPYFHQHQFATSVERQVASRLGVDWSAYEAANLKLYEEQK